MVQVDVRGEEQLARVAAAAKRAGPQFRKDLLAGIRKAGKPAADEVKQEAKATLPRRGRLNLWVAKSSIGVRTRTAGRGAGIRIQATKKGHDIAGINTGTVRHPVFGNRKRWAGTTVRPGFFDRPLTDEEPQVTARIHAVMDDTLVRIKRESGT